MVVERQLNVLAAGVNRQMLFMAETPTRPRLNKRSSFERETFLITGGLSFFSLQAAKRL